MSFNLPSGNTNKLTFGPGRLLVAPVGTTPQLGTSHEIGYVNTGIELAVTREKLEVKQGNPKLLVKQWVINENVQLTVHGLELDVTKLQTALGAGATTSSGKTDTLTFGADTNSAEYAVRFVHNMPNGATVYIDLWKAQLSGEMTLTFGDDPLQIPYVFVAQDSSTQWDGTPTPATGHLMRVIIENP